MMCKTKILWLNHNYPFKSVWKQNNSRAHLSAQAFAVLIKSLVEVLKLGYRSLLHFMLTLNKEADVANSKGMPNSIF